MTLTAEKTNVVNVVTEMTEADVAKSWLERERIPVSEGDFSRLQRCNSYRLLRGDKGTLKALYEHGGQIYAILSSYTSTPVVSGHYLFGEAVRVIAADDYQEETFPWDTNLFRKNALEGVRVECEGIPYVMVGSIVTFTTDSTASADTDNVQDSALSVQDSRPGNHIPQGILSQVCEIKGKSGKTVSANVQASVQVPAIQTQFPPIGTSLCLIPVRHIGPSLFNPRENFDEEYIAELAASIKENGLLQPITVRPVASGRWIIDGGMRRRNGENLDAPKEPFWQILDTTFLDTVKKFYNGTPLGPFWSQAEAEDNLPRYEIIAGERRWRASKVAETDTILALVRHLSDEKAKTLAVVENLQRKDLDPFEEGKGFRILLDLGWSQGEIAEKIGCNQSRISKVMNLGRLPEGVQQHIRSGALSPSHGQRLLSFAEFPEVCIALADAAAAKHWTVKQLEAPLGWDVGSALKDAKVAREFSQWDTAFDYKEICVERCPFRAYRGVSSSGGICLKPAHYNELQKEAKKKQLEETKGAAAKAVAGFRHITPGFTDLPMALPTVPVPIPTAPGTPETTEPFPAPDPVVPTLPKLAALKDFIALSETGQYGHNYSSEWNGYRMARPSGCSADCPCAGAALSRDNSVVQICTNPRRIRDLQTADEIAVREERTKKAERRLERTKKVIEETRGEGLAAWNPDGALRVTVLYLLEDQFTRYNGVALGIRGIARGYGVILPEEAIDPHRESLTPDGWKQLVAEASVPQLFLMLAEMLAKRDADSFGKGYGGGSDFTAELLALSSPTAGGITLSAKGNPHA